MNMKEQVTKILGDLKTTASKTVKTLSSLENNISDITQKIKAQLKKANDAKNPDINPSEAQSTKAANDSTTTGTTQTTNAASSVTTQASPAPSNPAPATNNPASATEAQKPEDTKPS